MRLALCVLGSGAAARACSPWIRTTPSSLPRASLAGCRRWFAQFGSLVADILHEVGVPYCGGGVMGKNDAWRGTMETWRARIAQWVARSIRPT